MNNLNSDNYITLLVFYCCFSVIYFLVCLELFFSWFLKKNSVLYNCSTYLERESYLLDSVYHSILYFSHFQANITLLLEMAYCFSAVEWSGRSLHAGCPIKTKFSKEPFYFANWKIKTGILWESTDWTFLGRLPLES